MTKHAVVVLATAVAVIAAATAASAPFGSATLRLVRIKPLTVAGQHFAPRERIRVVLSGDRSAVRRTKANPSGAFTVTFGDTGLTRCDTYRVVATGARGNSATLKHLPALACSPG